MKKYLVLIFSFVFLLFSNKVEAKTLSDENLIVSFGNEDKLDLTYTDINSFKINDDKSFYFNGVKHYFNDDYSRVDDLIEVVNKEFEMENDTFTIDINNKKVKSSKTHITYGFDVEVKVLKETSYEFTQELCYKYNNGEEICNIDKDDISTLSRDGDFNYYYDFMPFYKEEIIFDYIYYNFSFKESNTTYTKTIRFESNEINYKDSFNLMAYPYQYNNYYSSSYLGKQYVNLSSKYMYISVDSFNEFDNERTYEFYFYIIVNGKETKLNDDPILIKNTDDFSSYFRLNLSLSSYLYESNKLKYDSFKLRATYIYKSGDDTYSRRQNVLTNTNEETYYVSESIPTFNGEVNGSSITCGSVSCYASNKEVTNKISFEDDNGINKVYYVISKERLSKSEDINVEISNGESVSFGDDLEGIYYFYIKVLDYTGMYSSNYNSPYIYLFDKVGPSLEESNFDEYDSEGVYGDINIEVNYKDDQFTSVSGIYYKVISESEYDSVNKESIINSDNKYEDGVNIKDFVTSNGLYRVCFISYDYLNNYTDFDKARDCSYAYYIDITPLDKSEVSVSEAGDSYLSELALTISIEGVSDNVEFRCGVFSNGASVNEVMLTSTCLNNSSNKINFSGEGEYKLWIYASDIADNYNLIEFDKIYYLDNVSPRVSYLINGDNLSYSNSVKVSVNAIDINNINKSEYLFYQGSYESKEFTSFNITESITYPYNYYGEYKLALRICDIANNCSISSDNTIYKIDTGEIKLHLLGDEEIVILRYGKYKELGIEITKGINNSRVNLSYSVINGVDSSRVGEYLVTYTCGEGMNEVSVTRKVIVKDSLPYIYVLIASLVVGELIIVARLFIKKRKNDSI